MKIKTFKNMLTLESVGSTNTFVKDKCDDLVDGTVVFAEQQLQGRGRFERKWEGEKQKSIFASFLIKDITFPPDAIKYTFLFSLGVKRLLERYLDHNDIVLKWPNDILIGDKKICGILSEYSHKSAIIGIGLNVLDFATSEDISGIYTTMEQASGGKADDFSRIKHEFLDCINDVIKLHRDADINSLTRIWFEEAGLAGKHVDVKNRMEQNISGVVKGISEIGELIIAAEEGALTYINSGDICYND